MEERVPMDILPCIEVKVQDTQLNENGGIKEIPNDQHTEVVEDEFCDKGE